MIKVCKNRKNNSVHVSLIGILLLFTLFTWSQPGYPQSYRIPLGTSKAFSTVIEDSHHLSRFHFSFEGLNAVEITTEKGVFTELILPEGHSIGDLGTPKLPATKHLIEIPMGANVEVVVTNYSVTDIRLSDFGITYPLMPVQPSMVKNPDVPPVPFHYQQQSYHKSTHTAGDIANLELLGMLRGARLARLTIAPVAYNPDQNTIRVFNDIEIELRYTGSDMDLESFVKASTHSPYFDVVYKQLLNPSDRKLSLKSYPDLSLAPVKMLVISHVDFKETLKPFIAWQIQKGYQVIDAYTNEIGSSPESIKAFIRNKYQQSHPESPAPTFLVLVGDPSKLPASAIGSASKEVTDLYYASVDGDIFPDMYYGRLSARNNSELKNQIDKIIHYQKYLFADPSFLDDVTLIAGEDSFWNHQVLQPTVKYATNNYYNTANGFSRVNAFLTNYTGSYNAQNVAVGYINYTGHCHPTEWYSPSLKVNNIYQMKNAEQYPLVIGNCCQSGLFSISESIAEAWMRAKDKGAVAYIGSAPDTHWFEDFYWSTGAFPIVGNNAGYVPTVMETTIGAYDAPFVEDWVPVGAIQFIGNLSITQANIRGYQTQSNTTWYWEGYHTFGDPSTFIYHTQGKENNVNHFPVIPIENNTFEVEALPGSYVGLSKAGVLVAAGHVGETGTLVLPIQSITTPGTASLVVTKPQYIPYVKEINVASLDGPYVVLDHTAINDSDGNDNQLADYGESISLHLAFKNIGASAVGPLTAQLTGGDEFLTITNPGKQISIPPLAVAEGNNTASISDAFNLHISEQVPNEHVADFFLDITDGITRWRSYFRLTAYAPKLIISQDFAVDDSHSGNGNGRLDQGETATVSFRVTNKGKATANQPTVALQSKSEHLSVLEGFYQGLPIDPGNSMYATFTVRASYFADSGTQAPISVVAADGSTATLDTALTIGFSPKLTIGNENISSGQYPFYNIYKANRSQMLYLSEELGPGAKQIISVGFNIIQYSNEYNAFPNFKILMKHTSQNHFNNAFADMSDATVVFSSSLYQMPKSTGWHTWPVNSFDYNGQQNIIIEVVWGRLPGWTTNFFKVASTPYSSNRVAYGYSDLSPIPSFNGMSYLRPNISLSFTADPIPIPQPVTFVVKDGSGNALQNIIIQVGDMTMTTNQTGKVTFELLPGEYAYVARENGSPPFTQESFVVTNDPLTIHIELIKYYDVTFFVKDEKHNDISDAIISINGEQHEPGDYIISSLRAGNYDYIISKDFYFDHPGSFDLYNSNKTIMVTMVPDNTSGSNHEVSSGIKVFPVPARDQLFVDIPSSDHSTTISLHCMQGHQIQQIVVEKHATPGVRQFQVMGLPPGMYYIKVQEGEAISFTKVIIQ